MISTQVISTNLLRQATMWLGIAVSGGWLDRCNLGCVDGETYFNLEININRDDRPNHKSDRFEKAEALPQNISGRYRNRVTVPI